jgi:hypothetical protein
MKVPKATFATQSSYDSCYSPSRCSRTTNLYLYRALLSILAPTCLLSIALVVVNTPAEFGKVATAGTKNIVLTSST